MNDETKKFFTGLLNKVTGLKCIIITDREGVPLLKLAKHNKFPELGTRQPFLSTFSVANEQASKIGLGRNETIISIYNNHQVIQMNKNPLIVTFVGSDNFNTGHIIALNDQLDKYLEDYKLAVTDPN
ncbi:unnamed protein product [Diamesa serratosioi]